MANKEEKEAEKACMSLLSLCVSWSVDKNVFTSHLLVIPTALQLIFFAYLGSIRIRQIVKVCRIIRKKIHRPVYTYMSSTTTKFTFILWLLSFYMSMRSVQENCNYFYQMNWCLVVCCHFYDIISTLSSPFFSFTLSHLQAVPFKTYAFSNLFWLVHICLFYQ